MEEKWYRVCKSNDLINKPLSKNINGIPIVLFRGKEQKVGVLLDRCPHRNIQMSKGWVENENLVCRHHGWHFDTDGICKKVAQIKEDEENNERNAISFNSVEENGFIYVHCDASPKQFPQIKERPAEIKYLVPQVNNEKFLKFFLQLGIMLIIFGILIFLWFRLIPIFLIDKVDTF